MQKLYTDCAIHIVCIFGLRGEFFLQTHVVRYASEHPTNLTNQ